jgi:dUTP pyrophosphatase
MELKIMKIHSNAVIPKYAHEGDSGMDLFSIEETIIKPNEIKLIGTGIKTEIPLGYEIQIRPKSGLAANHGITVLNTPGTIDAGYRGEIKVILINHSEKEFLIEKQSKIAQMILKKVEQAEIIEVKEINETTRNDRGFGSTGLR